MQTPVQPVSSRDLFVASSAGRLFVRMWSPESPVSPVHLILFHDSLGSVELWRDFPARLCAATGRQVVAYDRLGFGKSDRHPNQLALDFIATEADDGFSAVRDHLDIGQFILFGHSVGGGMTVNCAARFSGACVGLMTESAQAFVEDRTVRGLEEAKEMFSDPRQVDRLARYHGDKARWVLDSWINTWLSPVFSAWTLAPVLPQVRCPVLAIHGSDDEYGSTRHPELIGQLAGGPVQVEIVAGAKHVPHREQEERVVDMVARFVKPLS